MSDDKIHLKDVIFMTAVFLLLLMFVVFISVRDSESIDRFCRDNPEQCMPAIYPGKVVEK